MPTTPHYPSLLSLKPYRWVIAIGQSVGEPNYVTPGVPSGSFIPQTGAWRSRLPHLNRQTWPGVPAGFQWSLFSTEPKAGLSILPIARSFSPVSPQPQTAVVSRKLKQILPKASPVSLSLVKHSVISYRCPCLLMSALSIKTHRRLPGDFFAGKFGHCVCPEVTFGSWQH